MILNTKSQANRNEVKFYFSCSSVDNDQKTSILEHKFIVFL